MTNTFILIGAALLPAIVLCIYIFIKDRVEKEPLGLLVKLLIGGVIICVPAAFIETYLFEMIDSAFGVNPNSLIAVPQDKEISYNIVKNFIGIALVEEGLKWAILLYLTRRNENFSHLFDGIVYAVFVSLGFAGFENIFYVFRYGIFNAVTRAILSVPGHMFFAVMMGYYYSMWHMNDMAAELERNAEFKGCIKVRKPFSSLRFIALSLLIPTLAHGFYDYCCTSGSELSLIMLLSFVLFMYVYCFGKIRKMSKADASDDSIAMKMFNRKYPGVVITEDIAEGIID